MLLGKLVRLRALEQHDYGVLAEWLNDPDVMVYWGRPGNTVSVEEVARQEQHNAARGNSRKYIIETLGGRPSGRSTTTIWTGRHGAHGHPSWWAIGNSGAVATAPMRCVP